MSHWNTYPRADKTYKDDDGNEQFGALYWGYRHPDTHLIIFSDVPADQPEPDEDPATDLARRATAAAQERAGELGVDVSTVEGSGKAGKVTKADVEKAAG